MNWTRFFAGPLMAAAPVSPGGGAPPVDPAAPAPAAAPAGPTQEQVDALKAQLADKERAAEFWFQKAKTGAPEPKTAPAVEDDPDLLEIITTGGAKAFDAYMRKRGYASREEVEATVNTKAAQLTAEKDLYDQYPDLKNKKSEFFAATATNYGELRKEGVPEAVAMRLAAEKAELEGIRTGKLKTPKEREAEERAAATADRKARAQAQGAERGGRAPEGDPEDDEITPEQRQIAIKMLAGDGVTEEQAVEKYKARAKAGVRMSMRGGR